MSAEAKLVELGLTLPPASEPKGLYRSAVVVGGLLHTSGHLPAADDGTLVTGRIGEGLDTDAGFDAAQRAGMSILATVRKELGTLDRVGRVVKILGLVNCTADFTAQPAVINGCSQLFADVFGDELGIGARSAVGVGSLPLGTPVEIEAVFEIE